MGIGSNTTVKSGNWSDPTVWDKGRAPIPGESTQIQYEHEIIFDADQNEFENGISLSLNGILEFAPDLNTYFKINNIRGGGILRVGTVENPIQRQAPGDSFRAGLEFMGDYSYIQLDSEPGSSNTLLEMHAWHHPLESTELSADAAAGQNQIKLEQDLDLQAGDVIGIGRGEYGTIEEMDKIYFVADYDKTNRIVTLGIPLISNRFSGDLVNVLSSPIYITCSDPNRHLMPAPNPQEETFPMNNVILDGCMINARLSPALNNPFDLSHYASGWKLNHCKSFGGLVLIEAIKNSEIRHCNISGQIFALVQDVYNMIIDDCCVIHGEIGYAGGDSIISNCKDQNSPQSPMAGLITNHLSKTGRVPHSINEGSTFKNSILEMSADEQRNYQGNQIKYVNCNIIAPAPIYTPNLIAYNTIIQGDFLSNPLINERPSESFNHNNLPGNYKAWTKGGTIETEQYMGIPQEGRLIFNCKSGKYQVFRDYHVTLSAYRWSWWNVKAIKSFTGGTVKMELIDPAEDPLVDPSAAALATSILPNEINSPTRLKISYISNRNMPAILRISAKNESGMVKMDTRSIEKRIKYGR